MNNNYDRYLLNEISIVVVFLCILAILAVIIACFGIKYFKNQQTKNAIACTTFFSVIIIACIVSVVYCIPYTSKAANVLRFVVIPICRTVAMMDTLYTPNDQK